MNKSVVVGMSGGVDSSVAALLLKEQGYNVIGVTIKLWNVEEVRSCEKICCSMEDVYDAKRVCDYLGIHHYTVNFKDEFKKNVVDYFINEYNNGNTPSPCIICNEKIKFGKMLEFAKSLGVDYIATGHYAEIIHSEKYNSIALKKGKDTKKDQTYMLYRLSAEQLSRVVFPLGNLSKSEVREIAKKNNLITHNKNDSQGICFVMGDYKRFLKEELENNIKPGNFIDKNGQIIGQHEGYQLYTIGQRRGLGLKNSEPYFINDILPDTNEILLGEFDGLYAKRVYVRDYIFNFLDRDKIEGMTVIARPRFSSVGNKAVLRIEEDEELSVEYEKENTQNARGQHIVFYDDDIVIGGGILK